MNVAEIGSHVFTKQSVPTPVTFARIRELSRRATRLCTAYGSLAGVQDDAAARTAATTSASGVPGPKTA